MAAKKLKIRVLARHIEHGKRGSESCPIALALRENGFKRAWVSSDSWSKTSNGQERSLPKEAHKFINGYDSGKKVLPFTFEIDPN